MSFGIGGGNPIDIPQNFIEIANVKRQYILIEDFEFITNFWSGLNH